MSTNKEQKKVISKKAKKEKEKKVIEESTFGLKNKNKSKKVQQFISRVEKSVKFSGDGLERERAKELKREAKLAKQLQEEQMRLLFQEAIGGQYGMKKSKAQANAAALGLNSARKEVTEFLETLESEDSEDYDSSDDDFASSPMAMEEEEDNTAGGVEVFREKSIEDIIEEQRAKLQAEGKKGTPVTEESFMKWRQDKLARKRADMETRVKAEQSKKKGGKGLSVLSGKELFSYNASLFVDDESAFDTTNDATLDNEMKELARREEEKQAEETRRAQEEQERLTAAHNLEVEARRYKEDARRQAATAPNRIMITFNDILINQVVFEDDEDEDLTLFADEQFVPDVRRIYKETAGDLSKMFERLNLSGNTNSNQVEDEEEETESDDEDQANQEDSKAEDNNSEEGNEEEDD
jgi:hypothetical protein